MAFNLNLPPSSSQGDQRVRDTARLKVHGARYELKVATTASTFASNHFRFAASAFVLMIGSGLLGFQLQPFRTHVQYDMTPTGSIGTKIEPARAKTRACE